MQAGVGANCWPHHNGQGCLNPFTVSPHFPVIPQAAVASQGRPQEEGHAQDEGKKDACWGSLLIKQARCAPDFAPGKNHFQHKFCSNCRAQGVKVEAARIRVMLSNLVHQNGTTVGFWNETAEIEGRYRVINQNAKCQPPIYILLEDPCSPIASSTSLAPVSADLVDDAGLVHLLVSKGTLVPVEPSWEASGRKRRRLPVTHKPPRSQSFPLPTSPAPAVGTAAGLAAGEVVLHEACLEDDVDLDDDGIEDAGRGDFDEILDAFFDNGAMGPRSLPGLAGTAAAQRLPVSHQSGGSSPTSGTESERSTAFLHDGDGPPTSTIEQDSRLSGDSSSDDAAAAYTAASSSSSCIRLQMVSPPTSPPEPPHPPEPAGTAGGGLADQASYAVDLALGLAQKAVGMASTASVLFTALFLVSVAHAVIPAERPQLISPPWALIMPMGAAAPIILQLLLECSRQMQSQKDERAARHRLLGVIVTLAAAGIIGTCRRGPELLQHYLLYAESNLNAGLEEEARARFLAGALGFGNCFTAAVALCLGAVHLVSKPNRLNSPWNTFRAVAILTGLVTCTSNTFIRFWVCPPVGLDGLPFSYPPGRTTSYATSMITMTIVLLMGVGMTSSARARLVGFAARSAARQPLGVTHSISIASFA